MIDLATVKDLAVIAGAAVGALTFLAALVQYKRNSTLSRVDKFQELRKTYLEREPIARLLPLIEHDDEKLRSEPYQSRMVLLGFYEEIALLYKSKAIKRAVVHYMFGYYAMRCWESNNFWFDLNRESPYWALFKWFVEDMKKHEDRFEGKSVRRLSL
jgi:hypothetical protein